MNFYKTLKWKRKRLAILRRDEYLCQEAKRYGRHESANTVHHIYPLQEYPELALINWNLISLSPKAHNQMEDQATGGLSDAGKQWQHRRQKEFEEFYAS